MSGPRLAPDGASDRTVRVTDYYPRQSKLKTGLHCDCPRCGESNLCDGLLTVRERCPVRDFENAYLNSSDGTDFIIIVFCSALVLEAIAHMQPFKA